MATALRPLRLPGFPNLGLAYLVNELGNWLGEIALAVLVFDQTGSPMATAALFCGMHFAPALLGPPLVARLEPLPVRLTLPGLYAAEAVAFAALALLADEFALVAVLAIATVDGSLASAARALTRAAATAVLAPAGQLREGNALLNIAFTARRRGRPGDRRAGRRGRRGRDGAARRRRLVPGGRGAAGDRPRARAARAEEPEARGASACGAGSPTCASARRCGACSAPRRSPSSSSRS